MTCNCGNNRCLGTSVGSCGGDCSCSCSATEKPYYLNAPACQENHSDTVYQVRYAAALKSINDTAVAAEGNFTLRIPGIEQIQIGSYLWNVQIGYLRVVGFDRLNETVTVANTTGVPGTLIPSCTLWNVEDREIGAAADTNVPYLAYDFTAPAIGDCLLITVTTTVGLSVGGVVQFGGGPRYSLSAINSSETITICNQGDGAPEGAIMVAKNDAGEYITSVVMVSQNPCGSPVETTGALVVCKDGALTTLDAPTVGAVPVVINSETNQVQFKVLDVPFTLCTILSSCINITTDVTVYNVVVQSTEGFTTGDVVHVPGATIIYKGTITVVDPTHITLTLDSAPTGNEVIPVGGAFCIAPCCELLDKKFTEITDATDLYVDQLFTPGSPTFRNCVNAVVASMAASAITPVITPTNPGDWYVVLPAYPTLFPAGDSIANQWAVIELHNPTFQTAMASVVVTYWGKLSFFGADEGGGPIMGYRLLPHIGYQCIAEASPFTDPWLFGNGELYTEVLPKITKQVLLDPMGAAYETPISVYTNYWVLAPGQKIRIAARPNFTLAGVDGNHNGDEIIIEEFGARIQGFLTTVSY